MKSADFATELAAVVVEVDEAYPHPSKTTSVDIDELRKFIVRKLKEHNLLPRSEEVEECNNPIVNAVIVIYGLIPTPLTHTKLLRSGEAVRRAWEYFRGEVDPE